MIEKFKIENESEADAYLNDLLAKDEYKSMHEVERRAKDLITQEALRNYFINKAREILKA
jgi:hypothetical protein